VVVVGGDFGGLVLLWTTTTTGEQQFTVIIISFSPEYQKEKNLPLLNHDHHEITIIQSQRISL
jgi:hypothetical protein